MFRKIAVLFLLILLAAGIYFFSNRNINEETDDPLSAIPVNAAVIIRSPDFQSVWKQLNATNLMWQELLPTPYFARLNEDALVLDSMINMILVLEESMKDNPLYLSLHRTGAAQLSALYTLKLETDEIDPSTILASLTDSEVKKRLSQNVTIYSIQLAQEESRILHLMVNRRILSASFNSVLLEDALSQLNNEKGLLQNTAFIQVFNTTGEHVDANVYLQYAELNSLLKSLLKGDEAVNFNPLEHFADWAALDLMLKPNALLFNGFTNVADSVHRFLSCLKGQLPQQLEITEVVPENTSNLICYGISDYSSYRKNYLTYLEEVKKDKGYNDWLAKINGDMSIDLEQEIAVVGGNEFAYFLSASAGNSTEQGIAAIKTSNHLEAVNFFNRISVNPGGNEDEIKQLKLTGLIKNYLGFGAKESVAEFWVNLDPYILIAENEQTLRQCLSNIKETKTLSKNENFRLFKENLSSESSLFVYSNFSSSKGFYRNQLNEQWSNWLETYESMLQKFEAIAVQFTADRNNLFYQNIYCNYNPTVKKESTSLWETELDSFPIIGKPYTVINHYTNAKEIFVQDSAFNVYLLDNKGNILWRKKIDGEIISVVKQIDVYRNNKLQLLFNTPTSLYLIDRKGRDVGNYPVKIEGGASAGMTLIDYEQNRNYRILLPSLSRKVLNFTGDGKIVKGWQMKTTANTISRPLQYFALNGKDYIIGVEDEGRIHVLDRKGSERLKISEKLPLSTSNDFHLELHKDILLCKLVATDSTGNVVKINMDGKKEDIQLGDFSPEHYFQFKDINNDKTYEYIYLDKDKLAVYESDKQLLFEVKLENEMNHPLQYISSLGKYGKFGLLDKYNSKIYLYLDAGGLEADFPMNGTTDFVIDDINSDGMSDVIVGMGSSLVVYSIRK